MNLNRCSLIFVGSIDPPVLEPVIEACIFLPANAKKKEKADGCESCQIKEILTIIYVNRDIFLYIFLIDFIMLFGAPKFCSLTGH